MNKSTMINSKTILALLTVCLLLLAGVAVHVAARGDEAAVAAASGASAATGEYADASGEITYVEDGHALLAYDPSNRRRLLGESGDVFFGRVIEQVGSEGRETSAPGVVKPETQFSVEVAESIKGRASGTVTVSQDGGYEDDGHADHEHLQLVNGDQLLQPGREYLFFTEYEKDEGWYVTSAPSEYAHVEIDGEEKRSEERQKAKKARAEQIVETNPEESAPPGNPNAGRPCRPDGSPVNPKAPCDPSAPRPPVTAPDSSKGPE